MKQNRVLTITTLIIAALAILLAGRCRKDDKPSAEAELAQPDTTAEMKPKIKEAAMPMVDESAPSDFVESKTFSATEGMTAEEALSASFHGQINRVLDDLYTSAEDVKQNIAALSDEEVLANADEYLAVLRYVKDKISTLTRDLAQLDITDMAGEEAREIKVQLAQANEQLEILKERYIFYLERLSLIGVNMREYGF